MSSVIAVDLGASSGRVMVGHLAEGKITLDEVHRFKNEQVLIEGSSCWALDEIHQHILTGIEKALATYIDIKGLAIDTWGVDFVLLDKAGQRLGEYVSYRDARTLGVLDRMIETQNLSKDVIYGKTGIQFLSFNTLYQLRALSDLAPAWLPQVDTLLFIPDYLNYLLCGVKHCEYTNASTSQMLNCKLKNWDSTLVEAAGAQRSWLLPPTMPNRVIGEHSSSKGGIPVISVASHDTASAVAATPLKSVHDAYISSGTWSLVGVESLTPCINSVAEQSNLTNEGGVDGRFRVLKNIMGLWLVQRVRAENDHLSFPDLIELAKKATPFEFILNPNDDSFLNPPSMTAAIQDWFTQRGLKAPITLAQVMRTIYDSLALAYASALNELEQALNLDIHTLRIVGGGSQDHFLNQLCADVCQVPVMTEPTEASALGNVMNQFIALGEITDLTSGREIIEASCEGKSFKPEAISNLDTIKAQYCAINN